MTFSHTKLQTFWNSPMDYYLKYVQGISPYIRSDALQIGSAVHWGIEHNTEDLTEYVATDAVTADMILPRAMLHAYFANKDRIWDSLLTMPDGSKATVAEEFHELPLTAPIGENDFMGIIDLLLLTDKGLILVDYKTSSKKPDWDKYLDQIYRYIFLLKHALPNTPILKIGIINLQKTLIRRRKNETETIFLQRLQNEYADLSDEYVLYHEYEPEALDAKIIESYNKNLQCMCDVAALMIENNLYFVNNNAVTPIFGKPEYYEIYNRVPDCEHLFCIRDTIYNADLGIFEANRRCRKIDLLTMDNSNILNHYTDFVKLYEDKAAWKTVKEKYIVDDELIDIYIETYQKLKEKEEAEKNEGKKGKETSE